MERGGHYRWWVGGVPKDPDEPFDYVPVSEQDGAVWVALREYQTVERYNDQAPAHLAWALPRVQMCWSVASVNSAKHAGTGIETLPCEAVLDWALWWVEEFTSPSVINQPWYDRHYTVAYRKAALLTQALAQPPSNEWAIRLAVGGAESLLVYQGGIVEALGWVFTPLDATPQDHHHARDDVERHFRHEVRAGRRPWESVP